MRYKAYGQKTVFDEWMEQKIKHNRTNILEEVGQYLDFEIFRATLERVFTTSNTGPLRFDPTPL